MCRLNLLKIKELIIHQQFDQLLIPCNNEIFTSMIKHLEDDYIEVLVQIEIVHPSQLQDCECEDNDQDEY